MNGAALASLGRSQIKAAHNDSITRRIKAYFVGRRIERRTLDELGMTTDRELADLGLSRYDVRRVAELAGRQAAEKYLAG
ncbi:DUF1127 domain-containing protein [Paracoccus aestuariivivens]|uniref:DUF1127 domain-containing protein n=1 Tax=Paracoccus aestuariivivens TaxID=1820333 RepID=A0A6L6JGQ2_9RHOB|nr:DUF1127 domain-containing protein [Paracoccus aestuariivivens]MTH79747.1 DUF1127 domain-containing protein [Paracoccus aestuariivivens]